MEMVKAAESGTYGYPHFDGNRETFCAWAQRRHGWTVPQEEVVICQGMLTSIAMMVETLTQPGDGVIVPMPAYQPFIRIVKNLERTLARHGR
jgi:cystathionine beta-lyase